MAFDESLADVIRSSLRDTPGIVEKKMFGGLGFLVDGNMLVGVWKDSMIVRVGPNQYVDSLKQPHTRVFDITGKAMKGWIMVDPEGLEEDRDIDAWIRTAIEFVQTLPPK